MRKVGSGSGEGLRKANSRVILHIPEANYPAEQGSKRPGTTQSASSKSLAQKYDTLLVFLGILVFLSVVGLFFAHSFYLNSSKIGDTMLPGQKLGGELVRPSVAAAGRASL